MIKAVVTMEIEHLNWKLDIYNNESAQDPETTTETPEPSATSTPTGAATKATASGSTSPIFGKRQETGRSRTSSLDQNQAPGRGPEERRSGQGLLIIQT